MGRTLPRLSPAAYRRVTLLAAVAVAFIIVTGAAVRLTGSGLGCTDWPTCEEGQLAPMSASDGHAVVEFVNRTITGLVSVAVMVAVLGSLLRLPRRADLTWLSLGLVAGVVGQIALGGLTVLFDLAPQLVMGHFLLSIVLLWNAVVLHGRAARPDGPTVSVVSAFVVGLGRLLLATAVLVVFTGTVVTATGPHAGDEEAKRLDLFLPDVARIHGTVVVLLLVLTLALLWALRREPVPRQVQQAAEVLLVVLAAQAGVGYVQYFTGVPALLVGVHVVGAVLLWVAVVRLNLALFAPVHVSGRPRPLSDRLRAQTVSAA